MLTTEASVVFGKKSEAAQKIAELGREATRYKSEKNIDAAILCLEQMWELIHHSKAYWAKTLIRLPMYLQYAGRFPEAEKRFEELLALASIAAKESGKDHDLPELHIHFAESHFLYDVYDAMRIAYKKEKLIEQSNKYRMLAQDYSVSTRHFSEKIEAARFKQLEKHQAWCAEMQAIADKENS